MKLLLTLGHNSSAIGVTDDNKIIAGYEEERLNREKSSSKFPKLAINKILEIHNPTGEENIIYVSHWFDNFKFVNCTEKHWDKKFITDLCNQYNFKVISLDYSFTHHDAHLYSVLGFYKDKIKKNFNGHAIIADGFGNMQEVYSVYEIKEGTPIKLLRNHNLKNSLGLMYQYATSFVGMKENQDEYKFLGYEAHIAELLTEEDLTILERRANKEIIKFANTIEDYIIGSISKDSEINIDAILDIKTYWWEIYQQLIDELCLSKTDILKFRATIGHFIQNIIEGCNKIIIEKFNIKNLLVSGGIFYNVKLNNYLMNNTQEFCVIPLAGDQGAAIGLYNYKEMNTLPFWDMCFGIRDLSNGKKFDNGDDILYFEDKEKMVEFVTSELSKNNIVEVVTGNMEFGPRALCNTSTIMLPHTDNVMLINELNKRNTIMPMAPIIRKEDAEYFFSKSDLEKVKASDEYMIITYKYNDNVEYNKYSGIMHHYKSENIFTGRPQFLTDKDNYIHKVLTNLSEANISKACVNTSFNYHGVPIVNTVEDAIEDFNKQKSNMPKDNNTKIFLVIGNF